MDVRIFLTIALLNSFKYASTTRPQQARARLADLAATSTKNQDFSSEKIEIPKGHCLEDEYQCLIPVKGFNTRGCECDTECSNFSQCCIDNQARELATPEPWACRQLDGYGFLYIRVGCKSGWIGDKNIRDSCLESSNKFQTDPKWYISYPLDSIPVTSLDSMVSYLNEECAICNGEINFQPWKLNLNCENPDSDDTNSSDVVGSLAYATKHNEWGYVRTNSIGRNEYHSCSMSYDSPIGINFTNSVYYCNSQPMVVDCPVSWKSDEIRRMCYSYVGVVVSENIYYKNYHCAVCNNVTVDSFMFCNAGLDVGVRGGFGYGYPGSNSLAILVDISEFAGNKVGRKLVKDDFPCSDKQLFDPFFKKCRDKICGKFKSEGCITKE